MSPSLLWRSTQTLPPTLGWNYHRVYLQQQRHKKPGPSRRRRLDVAIIALMCLALASVFWSDGLVCGVARSSVRGLCNRRDNKSHYMPGGDCSLGGHVTAVAALGIDVTDVCACIPRSNAIDPLSFCTGPTEAHLLNSRSLEAIRVAAVVPFYNRGGSPENERMLIECVESLRKQSVPMLTDVFVVIDGSSADNRVHGTTISDRLARALAMPGSKTGPATATIHIIQTHHHKGLPHARNVGVRAAMSASSRTPVRPYDYILFLDADDVAHPRTVELLAKTAEVTGADLTWGDIHFFGDQNLVWQTQEFNPYDLMWANHPATMALVRSSVFDRYGGYDENMTRGMEDWAFWSRISALGAKGARVPVPLFHYRRHGATLGVTMMAERESVTRDVLRSNFHVYEPKRLRELKRLHRMLMSVIVTSDCATTASEVDRLNAMRSAEATIKSLAIQSTEDFELLVIINGCGVGGGSKKRHVAPWLVAVQNVCKDACSFPVRVVNADGPAAMRNHGARVARGSLVAFLEPGDTLLDPLALEKLALALTTQTDASISAAYSNYAEFPGGDGHGRRGDRSWNASRFVHENYIGALYVVQRDVFAAVGGIDSACDGCQDHDFWLRFIQHGYAGAYVNETLYLLQHDSMAPASTKSSALSILKQLKTRNPVLYRNSCDKGPLGHYRPLELRLSRPDDAACVGRPYATEPSISPWPARLRDPNASDVLSDEAVAMLPRAHYRRPQHVFAYNVARYSAMAKPSLVYMVPHMAVGGAEMIDINILQGFRRHLHVTLIVETSDSTGLEERFADACDELFVLDRLPVPHRRLPELLDYILVSRNAAIVFNRNSLCAYKSSRRWRRKFPQLRQVDLLHLYEIPNGGWERESVPYHASYHARFVISESLREHMAAKYNLPATDFTVISNGLDYGVYDRIKADAARPSSPPVVGFIGRFEPQKRPLVWVRMAAALNERVPGVRLIMAGTGSQALAATRLAAWLDTKIDYITKPSPQLFASMSVLVLTSAFEGVPLVMLEAAAAGVPTIAPDVGGIREVSATLLGQVFPANASASDIATRVAAHLGRSQQSHRERAERRLRARRFFGVKGMQQAYQTKIKRLLDTRDGDRAREDYLFYSLDAPLFTRYES